MHDDKVNDYCQYFVYFMCSTLYKFSKNYKSKALTYSCHRTARRETVVTPCCDCQAIAICSAQLVSQRKPKTMPL